MRPAERQRSGAARVTREHRKDQNRSNEQALAVACIALLGMAPTPNAVYAPSRFTNLVRIAPDNRDVSNAVGLGSPGSPVHRVNVSPSSV